jgi:hypothetical protein
MRVGFRLPGQVVPRNRRKGFFLIPLHVLFLSTGRIASGLLAPLTAFSSEKKAMMKDSPWPNKKAMGFSAHGL